MEIKRGIPVSPGFAIHEAFVLGTEDFLVPRTSVKREEISSEIERLRRALEKTEEEIAELRDKASSKLGPELALIFDAHIKILEDDNIRKEFLRYIRQYACSAEYAVSSVIRKHAKLLRMMNDDYLSHRAIDIQDIGKRVVKNLLGERMEDLAHLTRPVILIAHDLSPSQTISFDRSHVRGFITETGGPTSHTALLARGLRIPAVVGVAGIVSDVSGGDLVILDGNDGHVIIRPDDETVKKYTARARDFHYMEKSLADLCSQIATTSDGVEITLLGNIELPEEIPAALDFGAAGIGLFRTEFLYFSHPYEPTEKEQFNVYKKAIEALSGKPLVIRTVDIGADKLTPQAEGKVESNPFLGCRAIRLCFERPELFKTQIRAILRATVHGEVRILIPMISSLEELKQAKAMIEEAKQELRRKEFPFREDTKIGIMIEIPSAAILSDVLAKHVDFFSIGTNDLIQYSLAVDRSNERVAKLYQPAHPAVLRLIKQVIQQANANGIDVCMCGEMAGDPLLSIMLLGMGLRCFSIVPSGIPEIKKVIRMVSVSQAEEISEKALSFGESKEVIAYLQNVRKSLALDNPIPQRHLDERGGRS